MLFINHQMRTKIITATIVVMGCFISILNAQDASKTIKLKELKEQKSKIITSEKELLKKEVESINELLVKEGITLEEAQKQKEAVARKRALNIDNQIAIIDNKIALVERNGTYNIEAEEPKVSIGIGVEDRGDGDVLLGIHVNTGKEKKVKFDKRTHLNFVVAAGFNNTVINGQVINDSEYKIGGSRFFEFGLVYTTRVFKNTNWMRFRYGLSYQSNGLKPVDNQYFVQIGDQTELQDFDVELEKSKFRLDHLVVPLYFEFGPSKKEEDEHKIRYKTDKKIKLGLGGYAGLRIVTRQKLKFEENGENVKEKTKKSFNTNELTYGLSGYFGVGDSSLYVKYDLSPVFNNSLMDQNNISLGVRIEL